MKDLPNKVIPLDNDPYATVKFAEDYAMREAGFTVYGYRHTKKNTLVHGYQETFHVLSDPTHPDNIGRLKQFEDQPDSPFHTLDWECVTDGPTWLELVREYDPDALPPLEYEVVATAGGKVTDVRELDDEIDGAITVAEVAERTEPRTAPARRAPRGG